MAALPGRSPAVSPLFPRPGTLVVARGRLGLPEATADAPPGGLPGVVLGRFGRSTLVVLVTAWGRALADLRTLEEVRP
jgi:hypothetical protein